MIVPDNIIILEDGPIKARRSVFFPLEKDKKKIVTTTQVHRGAIYALQGAMVKEDGEVTEEDFVLYTSKEEEEGFTHLIIQIKELEKALKAHQLQIMM